MRSSRCTTSGGRSDAQDDGSGDALPCCIRRKQSRRDRRNRYIAKRRLIVAADRDDGSIARECARGNLMIDLRGRDVKERRKAFRAHTVAHSDACSPEDCR